MQRLVQAGRTLSATAEGARNRLGVSNVQQTQSGNVSQSFYLSFNELVPKRGSNLYK